MCSNGAGLLRKIHGFVRFALTCSNSDVLLKKTRSFGYIYIFIILFVLKLKYKYIKTNSFHNKA